MKRFILSIAPMCILTACVSLEEMQLNLGYFIGRPIDSLIQLWGLPNSQYELGKEKVFVWSNSGISTMPMAERQITIDPSAFGGSYSTSHTVMDVSQYQCDIKIVTDQELIIQNFQFYGDSQGCGPYANALPKGDHRELPEYLRK